MWEDVFDPPPDQWGLRGDPYLWDDLKHRLAEARPPDSAWTARRQLHEEFEQLVGVPPNPYLGQDHVRVEAFAHGGMSGGMVDLRTWHDRLMPLLLERVERRLARQVPATATAAAAADEHHLRVPEDAEALLRRFEFGDAVLRQIQLDLPASGRRSAHLSLEIQERMGDDWRWTNITLAMHGLRAFRLSAGQTSYQVLTGPPVIVRLPDGTWIVDLARDQDTEPSEVLWRHSPHFIQGDDLSWRHS